MLVTTQEANRLIADVWFARADFARDHGPIIEGIVRGIFDAMERLKEQAEKQEGLRAHGRRLQHSGRPMHFPCSAMPTAPTGPRTSSSSSTRTIPTNFERIWQRAYLLYRRIGSISHRPVPFDQVMDFSIIQKLGQDEKYSSSKVEYETKVAPKELQTVRAEGEEILTNTVVIHFFPNSWDPFNTVSKTVNGKTVEERYDPNVENVLEEIAQLAGQFGTARIIIEGHTDSSMKGQVPVEAVKDLSLKRANAIKEALLKKYTDLDANRFNVDGVGWDRPVDPLNQSKNRRVEIKVLTAEKAN